MKISKKTIIILVIALLLLLAEYIVFTVWHHRTLGYQFEKLINGDSREKVMAVDYMWENRVEVAIPLLVEYVDSDEWFLYAGKVRWYLSCGATQALENITGKDLGHTCNDANEMTEQEIQEVKKRWKEWYKNEYCPNQLDSNTQ